MSGPMIVDNPTGTAGSGIVPILDAGTFDAGPCVTCEPMGGQYCGKIGDNCGGELECGDCKLDGYTCGGHGIDNVCGADPASGKCEIINCKQDTGKYCGKLGDGCGGELDCGGCDPNQECGARIPHVCGLPMNSPDCMAYACDTPTGKYCGEIGDGCGGKLDCGFCPSDQICGARFPKMCNTPCPLCDKVPMCPNGGTTTVRGVAVTGSLMNPDPLYNAQIFIPNIDIGQKLAPLPDGPSCDRCTPLTLDNSMASAITGPDGSFELKDVPAGMGIPIVVQLGGWRMQTAIDVMPCADNMLAAGTVRLPRNRNEGDIPATAIATGDVDRLQCLLRKLGIEDSEFGNPGSPARIHFYTSNGSRIDANTPPADTLTGALSGPGEWSKYTQVLFPCEGAEIQKGGDAQKNMLDYVNAGGRVFATHFSYTWLYMNGGLATAGTWMPAPPFGGQMNTLVGTIDVSTQKGMDFA
jgi:hypothetical protein